MVAADTIREYATAVAAACRRLHAGGLLAGAEGNVSVRLPSGDLLVTPSGVDKANVSAEQILWLDPHGDVRQAAATGNVIDQGLSRDSSNRPSSELGMHLACYAARSDVNAVVHAHPPTATGFATSGRTLPLNGLAELPVVVGAVALVPYGRPGTVALENAMEPFLPGHDVFLLANHGVTVVGSNLQEAVLLLETIEQAARILFVSELLGGVRPIADAEVEALVSLGRARKAEKFDDRERADGPF